MKSSDKFVVHCKSQEEWDAFLNYLGDTDSNIRDYNIDFPCAWVNSSRYVCAVVSVCYSKEFLSDAEFLSFEEFSERFLFKKGGSDIPKTTPDNSIHSPITMKELLKSNVNEFMTKVKQVGGNSSDLLNEYFDLIYKMSANGLKMELTKVTKGE